VTLHASGGFTGYGTQLEITNEGEAIGWSLTKSRDLIGQRWLSREECEELKRLLVPFAEWHRRYGHVTADGIAVSITAEVDGQEKTVTVYSSKDAAPPASWRELDMKLQSILRGLRDGR
jgi:hypothetical protein